MSKRRITACILTLVLSSTASAAAVSLGEANRQLQGAEFAPLKIAYPEVRESDIYIAVQRQEDWPLHISAERRGHQKRTFSLPQVAEQVQQLHLHGGKMIVASWMGPGTQVDIAVFDLTTGSQLDEFWTWNPVFSPDDKRIAFVKFYSAHFISDWEDQVFVYDLDASPTQNRPAYGTFKPSRDRRSLVEEVGLPLFPLATSELGRNNMSAEDMPSFHHMVTPGAPLSPRTT